MPTYLYCFINPDGSDGATFEWQQPISAPHLQTHPETGQPVRRVYVAPHISSRYTPGRTRSMLDNKNVERLGFTKYERDKLTGQYHRVAGKVGPATLREKHANPNL